MTDSITGSGNLFSILDCIQINLKHCKLASANLMAFMIEKKLKLALIQEPWVRNGKVKGLSHKDYLLLYKIIDGGKPRSCVFVHKSLTCFLLSNFSDADTTVVKLEGIQNSITVISAYFDRDRDIPNIKIVDLLNNYKNNYKSNNCSDDRQNVLVCCDANARSELWGSTEDNERGELLVDFITEFNLVVCNRGRSPTFYFPPGENSSGWSDVIDVTLCSNVNDLNVKGWEVCRENSYSDHKYITFSVDFKSHYLGKIRNPRNTNWDKFKVELFKSVDVLKNLQSHSSIDGIETSVKLLEASIKKAFESSCRKSSCSKSNLPSFFTTELRNQRRKVRSLYNAAFRTNDWCVYKAALRTYKKELVRAKRQTWIDFCESVEKTTEAARLRKVLAGSSSTPSFLQKEDGSWTESSLEMNHILVEKHFPGCSTHPNLNLPPLSPDVSCVNRIVTREKIIWAIHSFEDYKSPGVDGIVPKMLKTCSEFLGGILEIIYKDCLTLNYIPLSWRKSKVVFIPKSGKTNHSTAKDYRPISLSSFLLKVLERILDIYLRSKFNNVLISGQQHAYLKGKSVETALHEIVEIAERSIHHKQYSLAAFLDIEGAFNNVTTDAIERSLNALGAEASIILWVVNLLNSRSVVSTIGNYTSNFFVNRGTPQGGVLSPLLWLLVVNEILKIFEDKRIKAIAYADDVAIVCSGLFPQELSIQMSRTLKLLKNWAVSCGLNINPSKTELVMFTRRKLPSVFLTPTLDNTSLKLSNKAKYLGVILDSRLSWSSNMAERRKKAHFAFYACRKAFWENMGSETQNVSLDLHGDYKAYSELWGNCLVDGIEFQLQYSVYIKGAKTGVLSHHWST